MASAFPWQLFVFLGVFAGLLWWNPAPNSGGGDCSGGLDGGHDGGCAGDGGDGGCH